MLALLLLVLFVTFDAACVQLPVVCPRRVWCLCLCLPVLGAEGNGCQPLVGQRSVLTSCWQTLALLVFVSGPGIGDVSKFGARDQMDPHTPTHTQLASNEWIKTLRTREQQWGN